MYLKGRADLGIGAALKAIPLALAMAAGAKAIVDNRLHTRWAGGAAEMADWERPGAGLPLLPLLLLS